MGGCPHPEPGPNEVLLKQAAIGLNYIDVYFRSGLYKAPTMPLIIGQEGAGTVAALGSGVTNFAIGDRVAYAGAIGGYATQRVIAAIASSSCPTPSASRPAPR